MNIINPAVHVQSLQATYHNFPMCSALIVWTMESLLKDAPYKGHNTHYLPIKDIIQIISL